MFNCLTAYGEISYILKCSIVKRRFWNTVPGNTYHWIQFAKWMEYWQKFSFITSFSKGLIGYSLRYSGEREAAVCMSGIVGWVEGVQGRSAGEELRARQTGEYIKEAEGEGSTLQRDPNHLTGDTTAVVVVGGFKCCAPILEKHDCHI